MYGLTAILLASAHLLHPVPGEDPAQRDLVRVGDSRQVVEDVLGGLRNGNIGYGNTGTGNVGAFNTGDNNRGAYNEGTGNTGAFNGTSSSSSSSGSRTTTR